MNRPFPEDFLRRILGWCRRPRDSCVPKPPQGKWMLIRLLFYRIFSRIASTFTPTEWAVILLFQVLPYLRRYMDYFFIYRYIFWHLLDAAGREIALLFVNFGLSWSLIMLSSFCLGSRVGMTVGFLNALIFLILHLLTFSPRFLISAERYARFVLSLFGIQTYSYVWTYVFIVYHWVGIFILWGFFLGYIPGKLARIRSPLKYPLFALVSFLSIYFTFLFVWRWILNPVESLLSAGRSGVVVLSCNIILLILIKIGKQPTLFLIRVLYRTLKRTLKELIRRAIEYIETTGIEGAYRLRSRWP